MGTNLEPLALQVLTCPSQPLLLQEGSGFTISFAYKETEAQKSNDPELEGRRRLLLGAASSCVLERGSGQEIQWGELYCKGWEETGCMPNATCLLQPSSSQGKSAT